MEIPWDFTLKFGITLVSILNPLGAVPTFLILTRNMPQSEIKILSFTCSMTVMATVFIGLLCGQAILNFFGISIASFTIGGGFLLAFMAFNMISARPAKGKMGAEEIEEKLNAKEIGVVPLAIPLLSGPGSISTCIIHSREMVTPMHWPGAILVVILCGLIVKVVLVYARPIGEKMGTIGLNVLTRLMGIILLSTSIEMIIKGIKEVLPSLRQAWGA